VVLCRCRQHVHAQDARPKGFQLVIVRLFTGRDMVLKLAYPPALKQWQQFVPRGGVQALDNRLNNASPAARRPPGDPPSG
jgi:hypothetical protein